MSSPARKIKVPPATDFTEVKYGLIDRNGKLYNADHCGGHSSLYDQLQEAGILSRGDWDSCVHVNRFDFDYARSSPECRRVTQKQFDTMFDYALAHGTEFPFDILEVV